MLNVCQALKHVQCSDDSILIFNCYIWLSKCEILFMGIVFFIKQIDNSSRGEIILRLSFSYPLSLVLLKQGSVSCIQVARIRCQVLSSGARGTIPYVNAITGRGSGDLRLAWSVSQNCTRPKAN